MQVIVELHPDGPRLIDGRARQVRDVPAEKRIVERFDRKLIGEIIDEQRVCGECFIYRIDARLFQVLLRLC